MKSLIKVFSLFVLFVISSELVKAQVVQSELSAEIHKQANAGNPILNYPKSVIKYYEQTNFQPAWIKPQNGMGPTWQAMLMLDCVLSFGLSHDDYHPKILTYALVHDILDSVGKVNLKTQAAFDITLTDAIITLMNNLHYGKLNPDYSANKIDNETGLKFYAGTYLTDVLQQKDLLTAIADVQPKIKLYVDLQRRMQLIKGLYSGDCYEVPEAEIRKIAINMERLRWAAVDGDTYILINIPTYTLVYQRSDTAYQFKVAVGKPQTPTPTLQSEITHFTTGPEWKVPAKIFAKELLVKAIADTSYLENNHFAVYDNMGKYIEINKHQLAVIKKKPGNYYARQSAGCDNSLGAVVFRFTNAYDIYLHDTPEQRLFKKTERDLSHGCIRVEHADKLGRLLLQNDDQANLTGSFSAAMNAYQNKTFKLKTAVPIHIIYITCGIDDWGSVIYKDIYDLDKSLEMALYNVPQTLAFDK